MAFRRNRMKRRLVSFIAVIISVLISVTALSGCKLVTVDTEKDLDQIVATVKISENVPTAEIRKKEVAMAFLNYGEYYVSNMGYSVSDTYALIIDSLIQSRIFLQSAFIEFGAEELGKWDAKDYLSESEIEEAMYNTIKSMNDLIDSYENNAKYKKDAYATASVRAIPTNAANDDEVFDKDKYIEKYGEKGADIGEVGSERYKAYNKLLKILDTNGLLGEEEVEYIKDTTYFNDTLKSNYENQLIKKYENKIKKDARDAVSFDKLSDEYAEMYQAKVEGANNTAAFEEALSSATASNPVIYTPSTGYVFVYNLLLGANEEQTALIGKLDKESEDYDAERKNILSATTVKDQRDSWILSGYDFDFDSKKFTGDYAFTENSIAFQGSVDRLTEKTEKESATYRINSVNNFALDDFINCMDNYLYGNGKFEIGTAIADDATATIKNSIGENNIYKVVNKDRSAVSEYDEKINELLFAFSTDPGSLNTYKGYLVTPTPDVGGSEKYVEEFAKAGRAFITEGLGGASYVMVATDYGYHVMFFSQAITAKIDYPNLTAYLNSLGQDMGECATWSEYLDYVKANWEDFEESDFYLCTLLNLYSDADNVLNNKRTELYNKYNFDSTKVVRYTDNYSDLVTIEDAQA